MSFDLREHATAAGTDSRHRQAPPMTLKPRPTSPLIAIAAILLAAGPSASQHALDQDGVPVEIAESVGNRIASCKGDVSSLPTSLFSLDMNGDGRLDYVVNFENFDCETVPSPYCGTGGCLHEIWLSDRNGWKVSLSPYANLIAGIDIIDNLPALRLLVHHRYCTGEPCYQNIVWSAGKLVVVEVTK